MKLHYQQPNILPFPCLYSMFFYVFLVFYTQSLVLMLQYHISTTKHSTVQLFIQYVLLICDIVTLVLVIVCKIQGTHKRTYCINKGTVECLVVDI
jgi:hypothetical protein